MRARIFLYAATAGLSAFLLFTLELMVGRMLLPRFGGSPGVWNTALCFFQVALVVGYGWAGAGRRLGQRAHKLAQLLLVAAVGLLLPPGLPAGWQPTGTSPSLDALLILTARIGVPFIALATTSPLLQTWCLSWLPEGRDPYHLFAAGNLGSLGALVAYPTLVEPRLGLADQSRWWSGGFALFAVMLCACAAVAHSSDVRLGPPRSIRTRSTWRERFAWSSLAVVPSWLLLGTTRHLTLDVAPVALLWVVPLGIYLASFVVAFGRRRPRWVRPCASAVSVVSAVAVAVSISGTPRLLWQLTTLHLVAFAAACIAAHCWLADLRPPVERLTSFYLWLSIGGAVGGLAVAIVAPVVFDRVTEYPVGVGLAAVVGIASLGRGRLRSAVAPRVGLSSVAGVGAVLAMRSFHGWIPGWQPLLAGGVIAVVGAVMLRWPRLAATAVAGAVLWAAHDPRPTLQSVRSFFGVYRVAENKRGDHVLVVGTTTHGLQRQDPVDRRRAMSYYHSTGPVGHWFFDHAAGGPRQVAVVGLGAGAIAAYGRDGDRVDFYEIDPAVVRLARDPRLFTYLDDSPADVDVIVGDGRLELAGRANTYDLLVIDAFGSDAIPTHLMTLEAWRVYLDHLAPGGTLMLHLSNRSLDLVPVVARLADELGLVGFVAESNPNQMELADGALASTWAAVGRSPADLTGLAARSMWAPLAQQRQSSLWTDDRIDLLGALTLR